MSSFSERLINKEDILIISVADDEMVVCDDTFDTCRDEAALISDPERKKRDVIRDNNDNLHVIKGLYDIA